MNKKDWDTEEQMKSRNYQHGRQRFTKKQNKNIGNHSKKSDTYDRPHVVTRDGRVLDKKYSKMEIKILLK